MKFMFDFYLTKQMFQTFLHDLIQMGTYFEDNPSSMPSQAPIQHSVNGSGNVNEVRQTQYNP